MPDDSTPLLPFITAPLDDYGLTPGQFRVFCHVVRRGDCYATVTTIATVCRMHRDSVWDALRFLTDRGLLIRCGRAGQTTQFKAAPVSDWLPPIDPAESEGRPSSSATGQPLLSAGGSGNGGVATQRKRRATEVTPFEVTPFKEKKGTRAPSFRFVVPSIEEIKTQAAQIELPETEASKFFDYYHSKGWLVGKSRMKNWRSALSGWKTRWTEYSKNSRQSQPRNHGIHGTDTYAAAAQKKLDRDNQ